MLFGIFLLASAAAATTGSVFKPGVWYASLTKPSWTPPNWLFPVAWSFLYLASSVAAARVAVLDGNGAAMAFWAMQIAFNTLWTPIFFGLRRIRHALIAMVGLWLAVLGMVLTFWPLDWVAGLLVAPYLLWVTIAGLLNIAVVRLNPDVAPAAL